MKLTCTISAIFHLVVWECVSSELLSPDASLAYTWDRLHFNKQVARLNIIVYYLLTGVTLKRVSVLRRESLARNVAYTNVTVRVISLLEVVITIAVATQTAHNSRFLSMMK